MLIDKEQLETYIKDKGLDLKIRKRENVYNRVIICNFLLNHGMSHTEVGALFNLDRTTMIHYTKAYDMNIKYDDFKMLEYFIYNDLLKFVNNEKTETIEKAPDFSQLSPIEFKLLGANTMKDFRKIKDEVVNKCVNL